MRDPSCGLCRTHGCSVHKPEPERELAELSSLRREVAVLLAEVEDHNELILDWGTIVHGLDNRWHVWRHGELFATRDTLSAAIAALPDEAIPKEEQA